MEDIRIFTSGVGKEHGRFGGLDNPWRLGFVAAQAAQQFIVISLGDEDSFDT